MKLKRFNENVENSNKMDVKVKHMIEYLQKFDPEMSIYLDHDGWLEKSLGAVDEVDLIVKRGIFYHSTWDEKEHLTLNN